MCTARRPVLTAFTLFALAPACASAGGLVVFHSDRTGNSEIYSVGADGTDEKRLTHNDAYDGFPAFSADGGRVFFHSLRDDDDAIYSMNADGSDVTRIPNTKFGRYPKPSPDGARLAFFAERDGQTDIYVINADGGELKNLTSSNSIDETPSWTADGGTIAFQSDRAWRNADPEYAETADHPNFGIFLIDSDGSSIRELTGSAFNDENPSISPDGEKVVFQRYVNDGLAIATLDIATGEDRLLTSPSGASGSPAWSSSGNRIVFDALDDGNFDIYVMDADGGNRQQLTFTEETENSGAAMFDGPPLP